MNEDFCQNQTQKPFKKFSVEDYRLLLKAWRVGTNGSTDEEVVSDCNAIDRQSVVNSDGNQLDVDLSDISFESIPESPEIVRKRNLKTSDKCLKKSNKRCVSKFFHLESEVVFDTKESFTDDIEGTQSETLSQSCIDDNVVNDSQPIGQVIGGIDSRHTEDMHSVYLRSVLDRSVENSNKYKLQYNFDRNIDVFSQEPNDSDLEDYEMDSFCVPNDCVVFDESSPQTVAINELIQSPEQQKRSRNKRFKRIIFSP